MPTRIATPPTNYAPPGTPEPEVVTVVRIQREAILTEEAAQLQEMTSKWLELEGSLSPYMDALILYLIAKRATGRVFTHSNILSVGKYRTLLRETIRGLTTYTLYAEGLISYKQARYAYYGLNHAQEAIRFAYLGTQAPLYKALPTSAIEELLAFAAPGKPLGELLKKSWPEAVGAMTDKLVEGIAIGLNPRDVAYNMKDGLGVGLNRAMNIARTEQLRAYREAERLQYKASGLVTEYKRVAAHDDRVCAGCLFMEGTIYDAEYKFEEHPQGRCALVPIVTGVPELLWNGGISWFETQSEDYQRKILGPGRYHLWKDEGVPLERMVDRKIDNTWGNSLVPRPIYKIEKDQARRLVYSP